MVRCNHPEKKAKNADAFQPHHLLGERVDDVCSVDEMVGWGREGGGGRTMESAGVARDKHLLTMTNNSKVMGSSFFGRVSPLENLFRIFNFLTLCC